MFYVLLFSGLAVLLIVAGGTAIARNRAGTSHPEYAHHPSDAERRQRKATRHQSRTNRRKRH
jgi:hypothetical protein